MLATILISSILMFTFITLWWNKYVHFFPYVSTSICNFDGMSFLGEHRCIYYSTWQISLCPKWNCLTLKSLLHSKFLLITYRNKTQWRKQISLYITCCSFTIHSGIWNNFFVITILIHFLYVSICKCIFRENTIFILMTDLVRKLEIHLPKNICDLIGRRKNSTKSLWKSNVKKRCSTITSDKNFGHISLQSSQIPAL